MLLGVYNVILPGIPLLVAKRYSYIMVPLSISCWRPPSMISYYTNGLTSGSDDVGIVWYRSYISPIGLSLLVILIIVNSYGYANGFLQIAYFVVTTSIWVVMILMTLLVFTPLKVGLSEEGVHVVLPLRRRIIRWDDIEFIGRMMFKVSNNYGVIAVFEADNKVHSTGKFSSKVLEDMNYELRKHRGVPS
jgi:hypothetical protein